jgi:hypothetical protein
MGWLYQCDPIDDPVAYLTKQYSFDGETRSLHGLAAARVANTVYMAIRSTDKPGATFYMFAAVILISNSKKHGFGYKDMTEAMGPCQCDCPDRIMRLLSPISDIPNPSYSADWRARVAERKNEVRQRRARRKALRVGSTVTLQSAVRFPGGNTATMFCVS